MKLTWIQAVWEAALRVCRRHSRKDFWREEMIHEELDKIVEHTRSHGKTPDQTLTWALEGLRDLERIEFVDNRGH